jgi:hypothetical protein
MEGQGGGEAQGVADKKQNKKQRYSFCLGAFHPVHAN